ncbi:hypothetical protein RHSIM_Rhsim11G0036300 [Rhododendron simsii]|uniref:F-box associated beta-propeller type 3 domain-containing protein n=1 Tax=Rhododendron simsii TaxID=118357 RepID=A0A834LBH3_RHOSS|nr:hypothetical protein RHSIM_Rhsim11G0036300 [Rhododendron simsii]
MSQDARIEGHLSVLIVEKGSSSETNVWFGDDDTSTYRYALFPDETLASDACHDIDFLETPPLAFIYGPVNGLFCVRNNNHRFIIWNPAIREFRILPDHLEFPPNLDVVNLYCIFSGIGFGFDKSTDNYKVVLICHFRVKDMRMVNDVSVHVYSLSTNTWRHLNCLDYLSPEYLRHCSTCSGNGAYSDGVYYWWAGTGILAFDMGNEVFRVISVPFILPVEFDKCDVKPYNGDRIALYQFKGFPETGVDKCCDIWVMEEEGSWIKQFSVGPIPCRAFQQGVWKNGELLFLKLIQASYDRRYVFRLVLYNPCTRELRYLGPAEDFIGYQALVYHESLVSVNGLVFSEYLHSRLVLSFKEVNDEEPLFPAVSFLNVNKLAVLSGEAEDAAAAIVAWLQLGTKLSDVVTNKSDALAFFDLFRDDFVYLHWQEKNSGIKTRRLFDDCRRGGKLQISLDYVLREFNHVKKDERKHAITQVDIWEQINKGRKSLPMLQEVASTKGEDGREKSKSAGGSGHGGGLQLYFTNGDCEAHVDWTSEALGCFPEVMNLWIGNELSVTSSIGIIMRICTLLLRGRSISFSFRLRASTGCTSETSLMLSTTTQRTVENSNWSLKIQGSERGPGNETVIEKLIDMSPCIPNSKR